MPEFAESLRTAVVMVGGGRPGARGYTGSTSSGEVSAPMQFNVAQLLREPVGATREYTLTPEPPVHRGSVEMIRTPDGVLVRAEANVLIEAQCSRCLAPFAYPADITFEEIFYQQGDVVTGRRLQSD